jgi:DNA polymerase I-like protein with 3'-5' exonuclease and polymerase domains/5'-3' exonuclease
MANKDRKTLVLLDSHAIIHRAYHALPQFVSSKGMHTGALYGVSTMLMKIITDLKPDYVVACYDLPQKTFRHESYDGYKAGRAQADDALISQLKESRNIFNAFHIPMYDTPGFEADDMLGTIVSQVLAKEKNIDIIIASGDMDTLQLVTGERVKVFTLKKGINDTILYDEKNVVERFGFPPKLLVDYKGLRGDPSDNIIGVKGIGEKTATTLITTFGTVESIFKALKKNDPKLKEVGITERVKNLLLENEEEALFSKTLATIRHDAPIDFVVPSPFIEHLDPSKVEALFREYEFRSLIPKVSLIKNGGSAVSVDEPPAFVPEMKDEDLQELSIMMWLINSDKTQITPADIFAYTKKDSVESARQVLRDEIEKNNLVYVFDRIEAPLQKVIRKMEEVGIRVDVEYLKKLGEEYHKELSRYEKKIWGYAGREFNINSPKQLGEILFDEMKLTAKGLKKTEGGARSTRESELEKLKDSHPIIEEIFRYRELQKLLSTYIDTLPALVGEDGRLHAKFNQAGTTTGRFSSSEPNLQNIPVKTELGRKIRDAFIAKDGYMLVSLDYSQIELRIAALLSGDEFLTKVFADGKDVHSAVAMKVFGVGEGEVSQEMRRRAKVINFGILYGMGVNALKDALGTDRKEAQTFYDNYFIQFPKIQGYLDGVIEGVKKNGYTTTLFGRRRYFPGIKSPLPFIKAMAERMAINAPIQGTSADLIKIAILRVDEYLHSQKLENDIRLILQVHDELVFEVKKDIDPKILDDISALMKDCIPDNFTKDMKRVPLDVHLCTGKNWGELK